MPRPSQRREWGQPKRMAVAYDCGHALDPTNVADQLRGAAVAGIGCALYEQISYDGDGAPQTTTLSDYLIPTGLGLPTIDVLIFESAPASGNPLGLKGVGEAGADLVRALPIDRESIALASIGGAT
jgi:carbon-monoxide dehydrogenase large subunit